MARRGGKLPLSKLDVRAEGEEALVQPSHFTDGERVNGGPKKGRAFPRVPIVDFRLAFILSLPGTFVPRPSPRSRLSGEGGPKERRARLAGKGRSLRPLLPAPEPLQSPTLTVASVSPDIAGYQSQRQEETRAYCPGPLPTLGQGAPSQHAALCGGGEGPLSPLRSLGDFRSPLLAPTRGLSAWAADSTRGGRLGGEAEHGDPLKRRRPSSCTSWAAREKDVTPQCPHLRNGAKSVCLGVISGAHLQRRVRRPRAARSASREGEQPRRAPRRAGRRRRARAGAGAPRRSQHHGRQVVRGGGSGGGGGERGRVRVRRGQRGRVGLQSGAGRPVARALLVGAQAGQLRVGALAHLALVGALARVQAHVVAQRGRLAEAAVAEAAHEGLVQRVDAHVRAQVAARVEAAVADDAAHAARGARRRVRRVEVLWPRGRGPGGQAGRGRERAASLEPAQPRPVLPVPVPHVRPSQGPTASDRPVATAQIAGTGRGVGGAARALAWDQIGVGLRTMLRDLRDLVT